MALTEDQIKTLSGRAAIDAEFRQFLLAKPIEAAKELGIKLTKADAAWIMENAQRIKAFGERMDRTLKKEKIIVFIAVASPRKGLIAQKKKPLPRKDE